MAESVERTSSSHSSTSPGQPHHHHHHHHHSHGQSNVHDYAFDDSHHHIVARSPSHEDKHGHKVAGIMPIMDAGDRSTVDRNPDPPRIMNRFNTGDLVIIKATGYKYEITNCSYREDDKAWEYWLKSDPKGEAHGVPVKETKLKKNKQS